MGVFLGHYMLLYCDFDYSCVVDMSEKLNCFSFPNNVDDINAILIQLMAGRLST